MARRFWDEELKLALVRAPIYYRLLELEQDPYHRNAFARLDLSDRGWASFEQTLDIFINARSIDFNRPYDTASTLLIDASRLLAEMESSGAIFEGSAKETALRTVGRVARSHCLVAQSGSFGPWQQAVRDVAAFLPLDERVNRYHQLFRAMWHPDADLIRPPLSEVRPDDAFHEANDWGIAVGFP